MKRLFLIFTFLIPFCLFSQNETKADTTKKNANTTKTAVSVKDVKKFPEFPGGITKMKEYITQNLVKPKDAVSGKVYAKFIVDETGKAMNPTIIKGLNKNCDKAVIEMINKFPLFNPGLDKDGKPIICDLYLPVEFY